MRCIFIEPIFKSYNKCVATETINLFFKYLNDYCQIIPRKILYEYFFDIVALIVSNSIKKINIVQYVRAISGNNAILHAQTTKVNLVFYLMNTNKYLLCANRTQIAIM